jgi:hypothetical protein
MHRAFPALLAAALFATPASAQHAAHEHGVGTLNVAVDGGILEIELIAPANDIVGFEHAPSTDAHREAIAAAAAVLKDGIALFGPPAGAGCELHEADVASALIATEEHGDHGGDHGHGKDHGHDTDHGHDKDEHQDGETHSEFTARYHFECADPSALTYLDLTYFARFPRAAELDAQVLTATGQSAAELTAESNRLRF